MLSKKNNSGKIMNLIVQIEDWIQRIFIKRFTNEIISLEEVCLFVSDSRDDFLTFYKQTHTRFIAPVFVNWPRWFSSRGEKSSREVKFPQKQIPPIWAKKCYLPYVDVIEWSGVSDIKYNETTSGFSVIRLS